MDGPSYELWPLLLGQQTCDTQAHSGIDSYVCNTAFTSGRGNPPASVRHTNSLI